MSNHDWSNAPVAAVAYAPRDGLYYRRSFWSDHVFYWEDGQWHPSKSFKSLQQLVDDEYQYGRTEEHKNVLVRELPVIDGVAGRSPLFVWCFLGKSNQKLLAKHLGVSVGFISNVVRGVKALPVEHLKAVADFTGIPPAKLRPDIAEIFDIKSPPKLLPAKDYKYRSEL